MNHITRNRPRQIDRIHQAAKWAKKVWSSSYNWDSLRIKGWN